MRHAALCREGEPARLLLPPFRLRVPRRRMPRERCLLVEEQRTARTGQEGEGAAVRVRLAALAVLREGDLAGPICGPLLVQRGESD